MSAAWPLCHVQVAKDSPRLHTLPLKDGDAHYPATPPRFGTTPPLRTAHVSSGRLPPIPTVSRQGSGPSTLGSSPPPSYDSVVAGSRSQGSTPARSSRVLDHDTQMHAAQLRAVSFALDDGSRAGLSQATGTVCMPMLLLQDARM